MSTLSMSDSPRRSASQSRRSRPLTKYPLQCEALETRQLLSVGQGSIAPNVLPVAASPAAAMFAQNVSIGNAATNVATYTITFQTFYGITFIPINFGGAGGFTGGYNPGTVFGPSSPSGSIGGGVGSDPVSSPIGTTVGTTSVNSPSTNPFTSATPSPFTNSSITALNPAADQSATNPILPPAFVLLPPVVPVVVHFAPSVSPVTNIANSTAMSAIDEQPTLLTHFGQGPDFVEPRSLLSKGVVDNDPAPSVLDFVEPLKTGAPADGVNPAAPADGAKPDQGKPGAVPAEQNRPVVPPGITDRELAALTSFFDDTSLAAKRDSADLETGRRGGEAYYSWSLSTVFGATIIAAGGYHLALRDADRFKGRWVPRWVGVEKPTKRKSTT
jgi:hypothetical protein